MKKAALLRAAGAGRAARLALAILCCATTALAANETPATQPAPPAPDLHDVHANTRRLPPAVVDVVLSADGRRLAAAYFIPPRNRPGTDWDAWVACWDLATGRRTILPRAAAPIAISSDGQWLVAGLHEGRGTNGAWQAGRLKTVPAFWEFGAADPVRRLEANDPLDGTAAVAFRDDGNEVFAVDLNGRVLAWDVPGGGPGRTIDRITRPDDRDVRLVDYAGRWQPSLRAMGDRLVLLAPVHAAPWGADPYGILAEWGRHGGKWVRGGVVMLKSDPRGSDVVSAVDRLRAAGTPFRLALPADAAAYYVPPVARPSQARPIAFAPRQRLSAYLEPDASLAAIRHVSGDCLARFPAAAVHAFTPDGNRLITSDRRGILRFWDLASGRIARTLRCDDEPADTFLVAAVQAASEFGDPNANRRSLERLIDQAAAAGAQVVVLPEAAVTGYLTYDVQRTWRVGERPISAGLAGADPNDAAETIPGPSTHYFARVARRWGIYLTVPLLEADRKTGRYYNSVALLGPDGALLAHYRKLNPWPWGEQGWATDGDLGRPVVDTPFGRLGMLICYDIHKQAAEMAKLKIDTLLYSIAWVEEEGSDWFAQRLPELARRNGYHIVAANWTLPAGSEKPKWFGYGQSEVLSASGKVLSRTRGDIGPDVVFAELPLPK